MKLVILSDIHDNVWNLEAALQNAQDCDVMLCCGDLCAPFMVKVLAEGFSGPIHFVLGNNDGDGARLAANAAAYNHVTLHHELFVGTLDQIIVAMNHYPAIARNLVTTGQYDLVCYGHNHLYDVETIGDNLLVNPGAIMGYDGVNRIDVEPSFVKWDIRSRELTQCRIQWANRDYTIVEESV